jgi:hypothetical protein
MPLDFRAELTALSVTLQPQVKQLKIDLEVMASGGARDRLKLLTETHGANPFKRRPGSIAAHLPGNVANDFHAVLDRYHLVRGTIATPIYWNIAGYSKEPASAQQHIADGLLLVSNALTLAAGGLARFDGATVTQAAFGADPLSATARALLLGRPPAAPSWPGTIPLGTGLLDQATVDGLILAGSLNKLFAALGRLGIVGADHAAWTKSVRAYADGIVAVAPVSICPGQTLVIRLGSPIPDPAKARVCLPQAGDGCAEVDPKDVKWDNDAISLTVPSWIGSGCVGFRESTGSPPDLAGAMADLAAATGGYHQALIDALGPKAAGFMGGLQKLELLGRGAGIDLPCPPCLPAADGIIPNHISAGSPHIRSFTVNGVSDLQIHGREPLTFAWSIDEAAEPITIRLLTGTPSRHEILGAVEGPPLPRPEFKAAQDRIGTLGPVTLGYEGYDDWDLEFSLVASNPCSPTPDSKTVRIRIREPEQTLFGMADAHVHFFSELGFGGFGVHGSVRPAHPSTTGNAALQEALGSCEGYMAHGVGGLVPSFEGLFHRTEGYPHFKDWPKYSTLAHQQAFIDWIERAYQGGLRLAVCLAVSNRLWPARQFELRELINELGLSPPVDVSVTPGHDKQDRVSDKPAIARQLAAMRDFVAFVDDQAGGPGLGWVQIADTPVKAREIIKSNKLALVPGVEVDVLGDWHTDQDVYNEAAQRGVNPQVLIDELLDGLASDGVRHVFPVHGTNNAFGGAAVFVLDYDAVNFLIHRKSFEVDPAPPGSNITYRIDQDFPRAGDGATGAISAFVAYHGVKKFRDAIEFAKVLGAGPAPLFVALLIVIGTPPFMIGWILGSIGIGPLLGVPVMAAALVLAGSIASIIEQSPVPPKPTNWRNLENSQGGHINRQGLTVIGEMLIRSLMKRGMIIDVDHMGYYTINRVLTICEETRYPLVSGHSNFREQRYGWPCPPLNPDGTPNTLPTYVRSTDTDPGTSWNYGTGNTGRLTTETDRSPEDLRRIRALGGFVAPMLHQRELPACGCDCQHNQVVLDDSSGTSKSFARAYLYARRQMNGRRVGFGSDINGFAELPGPRFGPVGSPFAGKTVDYGYRSIPPRRLRCDEVFAQQNGVQYAESPMEYRAHRFEDMAAQEANGEAMDREQRCFWEALVVVAAGKLPADVSDVDLFHKRGPTDRALVINLVAGINAPSASAIPVVLGLSILEQAIYWPVADWQRAAYIVTHPGTPLPQPSVPEVTRLVDKCVPVKRNWDNMQSAGGGNQLDYQFLYDLGPNRSALYDQAGRLKRSVAGNRDFDINMDGMAHYGMLPDLMQDIRNVVGNEPLATMYRSAEDYVRMWELCVERSKA